MLRMNWNMAQKGLVLIAVPLLFELAFVWTSYTVIEEAQAKLNQANRLRQFTVKSDHIALSTVQAAMLASAYFLSGDEKIKKRYKNTTQAIGNNLRQLKVLAADNPLLALKLRGTGVDLGKGASLLDEFLSTHRQMSLQQLMVDPRALSIAREITSLWLSLSNSMKAAGREAAFLLPQAKDEMYGLAVYKIFCAGLVQSLVITLGLWLFFKRDISGRIKQIMKNAYCLGSGEILQEQISGQDEIAELDRVFHQTAQRLQELKNTQKQLKSLLVIRLQQPLQIVNQATKELLEFHMAELNEKTKERLQATQESAARMERLILELQAEVDPNTYVLPLHFEQFDVNTIIDSVLVDLQEIANQQQIKIQSFRNDGAVVFADRDRITQVLINLIMNAINHSPPRGIITLSISASDKWLRISVTDQGPGINESDQKIVFQPFVHIPRNASSRQEGSGLGLYICKNIIERHGGNIYIAPYTGKGSSLIVELPKSEN